MQSLEVEEQWGENAPRAGGSVDGTDVRKEASQRHLLSSFSEEVVNPLTLGDQHGELGEFIFRDSWDKR